MEFRVGRLENVEKGVGGQVCLETFFHNPLGQFRQVGQVGDGAVVGEVVWIQGWFFDEWSDNGLLEECRKGA